MKKGPHKMMLESSRYDKWDRERDRGGGGGGPAPGSWPARDRERDRERERQARAHQMSHAHAAEPDASSSLFPAPFRLPVGNRDRVSQQIQIKLGDYHLAQTLFDDPSKSIGICTEPPSPAPCPPSSRRESEFKKPAHAPQNGRNHHRPYAYSKSDVSGNSTSQSHRPPPIRIQNGFQNQNSLDSSQRPIESILKEMKSIPTPLSVIAATPRKELDNKFIFNPFTNKVQENPQLANNDLKTSLPKPGLDNRISNIRSSVSPDVVNKDLGLSESEDEVGAAHTTRLEPILSPIGSGASPSSASESSQSDSESESSSAESTAPVPPPPTSAAAPPANPAPAQRSSWSLSNFAPPPAQQPPEQAYDSGKDLRNALADVKGKPSPISELSDSEASSASPATSRRRRTSTKRTSTGSSDEDTSQANNTPSPRVSGVKRGRPPKARGSEERPAKKKRGRPPKKPPSPPPPEPPVQHPHVAHLHSDVKSQIYRKVFTPKKGDEGGGKGGKGGKGKGGKGKGQVTIIEVTAPESGNDDDDRRLRDRSIERRNEEAIARVSPPHEEPLPRRREAERGSHERIERSSIERSDHRREERIPSERNSTSDRNSSDRSMERISLMSDRHANRLSSPRIPGDRLTSPRIPTDRLTSPRIPTDRLTSPRIPTDRLTSPRLPGGLSDRLSDRHMNDRLTERGSTDKLDRLSIDKLSLERGDKLDRLSGEKMSIDRGGDKMIDRLDRYVRAEADVGSGVKSERRESERLEEDSTNVSERPRRSRVLVRVPLCRLRPETLRALQPPAPPAPPRTPPPALSGEVAATNHERSEGGSGQTPIYYSYFERLPPDALSDEERDHKYYLGESKRLRLAAEREQEPLARVMLYLESVLCFVLTGRVLELELDTKRAFTIYRETIEYIKSIHSMPQRFRASPHSTFSKLDILILRVQALLYLRMFKMYNREVKDYYKIVQEYQQKPACAESVSPLSPTPSPAGSLGSGSLGSLGSGSSGYGSGGALAVPAQAHHALLQLTKYYTFLYVAHDLWEQADSLCRRRPNQDLFIAVDRKCGPLTLFSTFRHLVQYVRYAISLLKNAPRE